MNTTPRTPIQPRERRLPRILRTIGLWAGVCFAISTAAPTQDPATAGHTEAARIESSLITLLTIHESIERKSEELSQLQTAVRSESDEQRRLATLNEAKQVQAELEQMRRDFDSVASGVDVQGFVSASGRAFDLKTEIEKLVQPLIQQLKEATADPRQIEQLRSDVAYQQQRIAVADQAIDNIQKLIAKEPGAPLDAALATELRTWRERREAAVQQEQIARFQYEKRQQERKSLLDSTRSLLGGFFRSRGKNLLFALAAFLAVLFGLRLLFRPVQRVALTSHGGSRTFYVRLIRVLFHVFATFAALLASLLVLYVAGDWVLLGLVMLFLLGIVWASKQTLPRFFEQIRLMLNLGAVREREKVMFDGLPWRVDALNVYTRLVNPELAGGRLRLPIRDLIGLHSRPCTGDDVWFPSRLNDWVQLSDGVVGRVVYQTPEAVRIERLGGSLTTYQTEAYLELGPRNLSFGFRLVVTFGIDYRHQSICTTVVPRIMQDKLESELRATIGDALVRAQVEFKEAGSSSLDYAALVDVSGEVAERFHRLQRAIQRILVDACNENGWVIPFTQVTLHQAESA